ncbi:MAG: phage tail tape measure protein [Selenomonadaceae bacterium]|nr:phage tail tape measure protein [Selenomonadaceae bacterium]
MAKSRTIEFQIIGNDQLSRVLANAQKNLKGLTSTTLARQNKSLQAAQGVLRNIEAYNKLQKAIQATTAAQIQNRADQPKLLKQRQEAVAQLDDMKKAYARLKDVYKANWLSMGTQAATAMKEQIRNAGQEIKNQQRNIQSIDRALDSLPKTAQKLREQLASQQAELTQLRSRVPTANIAAAEAALRAQINQTTQAINQEIAALERRNQIHANFSQRQQELSTAYSNFQSSLDTAQTIMNPFKDAADNAMTFEKSISRLKSLTQMRAIRSGDTANVQREMESMTATIERLGMTTEYTANQIAGAANFYAISGWKPEQINSVLPSTVDLASIAQVPIDRVADMVSDDMTAFGVKAGASYQLAGGKVVDGARYFSDSVAYAVTQANFDLATFHEAWKYNAPVARAMNLSLGESIAQNMVLANAGIKGSMSGTSLRQFWVRLSAPPKAAAKSLEELGFAANDAAAQVAETQLAMQEAGATMDSDLFTKIEALQKFYQEGKAAGRDMTGWLKGLSGQTALSGVMSLFESGKLDEAKRYAKEIDSGFAAGWSADTAKIMRDNTRTSIDYLTSALDALQKAGGDALLPSIRGVAESVTPLITSLAEFTKQNPAVVKGLAAIATAASAAIVGLAGFSLAMAGIRFAGAGLQTAGELFAFLGTKIAAARVALSGFGAGLVARISTLGAALSGMTFSSAVAGMKAFGAATLSAARAGLMFMFTPLGAALTAIALAAYFAYKNWDKVSAAFSTLGNALSSSLGPAFSNLGTSIGNLMTSLSPLAGVFETLGGVIVSVLVGALGTAGSLISGLAVLMTGLLQSLIEFGTGIVDAFAKIKDGDLSGALDSLKNAATTSADSFKNAWLDAAAAVKSGLQGTDAAVQQLWTQPQISGGGVGAIQSQIAQVDTTAITQPIADASTQTADSLNQVNLPAQATGQSLTPLPPAIDGATNASTQLSAALPAPISGLDALGSAASSAAAALESAAARISSINIQVPQISYVPMSVPVAHNAKGGIYRQGAFLTTFAEDSAEAAIPLTRSQNSYNLWQQTGDLLGFNQGGAPINISLTVNVAGNADKDTAQRVWTEALKPNLDDFAEQLADFRHERKRRSFA